MLPSPPPKAQKIILVVTAIMIVVLLIGICNRPKKLIYHDDVIRPLSSAKVDSLELTIKEQKKLNDSYVIRIAELEKSIDSIKTLMEQNSKKITTIKKRRTDEKKVNYNAWTDNEFTRFFSNRYQQH